MTRVFVTALLCIVLTGCVTARREASAVHSRIEVRAAGFDASDAADQLTTPDKQSIYVAKPAVLTDVDFVEATLTTDQHGNRAVYLTLTDEAAGRFYEFTRGHISRPIAIFIDGELIIAPVISSALRTHVVIRGGKDGLTQQQVVQILSAVQSR